MVQKVNQPVPNRFEGIWDNIYKVFKTMVLFIT